MADEAEAVKLARLEERVLSLTEMVKSLADEVREGNRSRKVLYEGQEKINHDLIEVRHRMGHLQDGLDAIRPTTAEYVRLRDQAIGAGRLGTIAWRVGGVVLAAAGWLAAAYTTFTGRPPP